MIILDSLDNMPVDFCPYNRYFWPHDPRVCLIYIYTGGRGNPTILTKLAYRLFFAIPTAESGYNVSSKDKNNRLLLWSKWPSLKAYFQGFKAVSFVYFWLSILYIKQCFLRSNYYVEILGVS